MLHAHSKQMVSRPVPRQQAGFNLVELMIGSALGLILLTGAVSMFSGSLRSNAQLLASSQLNQDVSTVMSIITSELRRAGFGTGTTWDGESSLAPLNLVSSSCVLYAYDRNDNQVIDPGERGGFRLNNGNITMRRSCTNDANDICSTNCTAGTWEGMLDPALINVTNFAMSTDGSKCLHAGSGDFWVITPETDSIVFPCRQWFLDGDGDGDRTNNTAGLTVYSRVLDPDLNKRVYRVVNPAVLPDLCTAQNSASDSPDNMPGMENYLNGVIETKRVNLALNANVTTNDGMVFQKDLETSVKVRNEQLRNESPTEAICGLPGGVPTGYTSYENCVQTNAAIKGFDNCE